MVTKSNTFQISAAILLLLAGCGGGGGGSEAPKAVSSSPAAPGASSSTSTQSSAESQAAQDAAKAAREAAEASAALTAAVQAAIQASQEEAAAEQAAAEKIAAAEKAAAEAKAKQEAAEKATREAKADAAAQAAEAQKAAEAQAAAEAAAAAAKREAAEAKAKAEAALATQKAREEAATTAKAEAEAAANNSNNGNTAINRPNLTHPSDPIHPGGVNGAVLAAMLDQHSDTVANDPQSIGYPVDNDEAPPVLATQSRDPGYTGEGRGVLGTYAPASGSYTYFTFNGGKATGEGGNANFAVNQITSSMQVINGTDGVTLPATLTATEEGVFDYRQGTTFTGTAETVKYDEEVASGKHVFEWKNGTDFVQLSVTVTGTDTAQSCWTYKLPKTSRTYCNLWQVPSGFKKGQALVHKGFTLVDSLDNQLEGKKNRWASR
jgi:hypothetical protein